MVLKKLSSTGSLKKIATPQNVPRLFGLIKPKKPRFAPAFFKGLGNTLVTEDLDRADRSLAVSVDGRCHADRPTD
jgi:structural maintenance of chromosome 4